MSKKPDLAGLTKKEKKEYLKDYRQGEEKKAGLATTLKKVIIGLVIVAVIGGVGYLFATSDPDSVSNSRLGEEIEDLGSNHITQGDSVTTYNSNPPTSGPHWPSPAECKIYNEKVPDEAVVHSLEHGAVWVSYKDAEDKDLVAKLEEVVNRNPGKIILSPRSANDADIALVSWNRLLELEEFDENQITEFVKSNRNSAPEPFAQC